MRRISWMVVAAIFLGEYGAGLLDPPATTKVSVSSITGEKPGREVWWTTTACPPGVDVPCLDGTVALADLPGWALS